MKKIFILLLTAFSCLGAMADSELQVLPFKAVANDGNPEWDSYLEITLENDVNIAGMQFDLYLPEGMTIDDDGFELTTDRWTGTVNKKTGVFSPNATTEVTDKGNGHYFVTLYDQNNFQKGNSGVAFIIYYKTGAMADGVYPIRIENAKMGPTANPSEGAILPVSTSYVVIGDPTNATLSMEGAIPSFVNEALASETAIGTLDLTKVTASNGTFTYVDGRAVKAPEGLKGKVAYKRSVSGLASICLPFAADIKAYTYSNMAGEYAIFDEVSALEANTPAIVNANIDITVADATIGSVEGKTINSGYYLKGGNLCKVNGSAKIAPLRGCWDITAPVKGFKFNDADAILTVDANANEDIFNLNGVKLNKAQRGVNIIGGKKVMK